MKNIYRIKKNDNFVVMDKTFLYNRNLSWKAKGILAFMLSKPDDWTFYIDELVKHSTDGEHSFRAGFKELTEQGYVKRKPVREGQRIKRWETLVYENPLLSDSQDVENLNVENQDVEKQDVGNQALLSINNTKNNSTNNNNTKNDIYIRSIFEHWNSKGIIRHRELTQKRKSAINARLKSYSVKELEEVINNYATILQSDKYYWTHKWPLEQFFNPTNMERFLNEQNPFNQFMKRSKKQTNGYVPMEDRYDPTEHEF